MSAFKINRLFRPGPNGNLNACVGENGGPYDFFDYALGYFKSATAIARAAGTVELPVDIAVYPMVYSYRHGIELCLKHLARVLPALYSDQPIVRPTHELMEIWGLVKPYLARRPRFEPGTTIPLMEEVIKDVSAFDPNGEVFRFPEDRKGELHLQEARIINLDVLREAVEETADLFSYWVHTANEYREAALESR